MSEPESNLLHFAFGSPQRFIAQARRTRDLWAGSYLLSWLCGRAMSALETRVPGVEFLMPDVTNDALYIQIHDPNDSIEPADLEAHLGSLPTRFSVILPDEADPEECGRCCQEAVDKAWMQVVDAVKGIVSNSKWEDTQDEIWQRQTTGFWPCHWVAGGDPGSMDRRKRLGSPLPPGESGLKCTVCGERQELSGEAQRPREAGNWWKKIRTSQEIHDLDLRPNERLCAICLVKRLFPKVAERAIGWRVPEFYPSTAYVAAIDWLSRTLELADAHESVEEALRRLIKAVPDRIVAREEARNWAPIRSIRAKLEHLPDDLRPIQAISGSVFFEEGLRSDDLELSDRDGAIQALKALQKAVEKSSPGGEERSRATPFYAMLMMDGDGMGELFATYPLERQRALAQALARFNQRVPEIVRSHDGWLIYAAGEDVFALLPVSRAIQCARAIRWAYRLALLENASFVPDALATISAAINFAHMNSALGTIVSDTHNSLLDGAAKDEAGRDAIACRIWKRGGPILTWAQPWDLCSSGRLAETAREIFARGGYSSGFFYKLEGLFRMHQGNGGSFDDPQLRDLLVAEYLANRELEEKACDPDTAIRYVDQLMALCRQWQREITKEGAAFFRPGGFSDSGALLVRFLHQKEV